MHEVRDKSHFAVGLIRGLGGNLNDKNLNDFSKLVLNMVGDNPADSNNAYNITYDKRAQCIRSYVNEVNKKSYLKNLT